jgi:hypothetical protein
VCCSLTSGGGGGAAAPPPPAPPPPPPLLPEPHLLGGHQVKGLGGSLAWPHAAAEGGQAGGALVVLLIVEPLHLRPPPLAQVPLKGRRLRPTSTPSPGSVGIWLAASWATLSQRSTAAGAIHRVHCCQHTHFELENQAATSRTHMGRTPFTAVPPTWCFSGCALCGLLQRLRPLCLSGGCLALRWARRLRGQPSCAGHWEVSRCGAVSRS